MCVFILASRGVVEYIRKTKVLLGDIRVAPVQIPIISKRKKLRLIGIHPKKGRDLWKSPNHDREFLEPQTYVLG